MNHEEFIETKRKEVVSVASLILSGEINAIEGIRRLNELRTFMEDSEDEVFLPIQAIDSETDRFPVGAQRVNWTPEFLKKIDQETEEYLSAARDDIFESCRQIVRLYSD